VLLYDTLCFCKHLLGCFRLLFVDEDDDCSNEWDLEGLFNHSMGKISITVEGALRRRHQHLYSEVDELCLDFCILVVLNHKGRDAADLLVGLLQGLFCY